MILTWLLGECRRVESRKASCLECVMLRWNEVRAQARAFKHEVTVSILPWTIGEMIADEPELQEDHHHHDMSP